MTKKPSEKNKAWEKDRRDRLNKTFDELAKLLPKFDQSVIWSKIEIIQKAITFITDLNKRLEDYLEAKDPELLKEYKEFINCLRFYQERNAQLTELLKKAKVTLPPPSVELPQLLVNKPELLPNQEDVKVVQLSKPKRQRNRSKKGTDANVSDEKKAEVKEKNQHQIETCSEKVEAKTTKLESVTKPTAIITAFGREILNDAPTAPIPQPTPSQTVQNLPTVPAKPLLLRLRKLRKRHQRLKLIPKPMFRKCYPHPSRMIKWNFDVTKLSSKQHQRRQTAKRTQKRKDKPSKRHKVEFGLNPAPPPPPSSTSMREQSVSPTAAFLLSFPVVTSSMLGGKNVENTDNLENLNNFFTTEEYSKFCDQNSVAGEKILSPLAAENEGKPSVSEKQITAFTVSAITRPSTPKKTPEIESRLNGIGFENCFNGNPMLGSTSMCGVSSNNQQIATKQFSTANSVFPSSITFPAKLPLKAQQVNLQSGPPNSSSEKFFPRYNHSTSSSLRNALETPSKVFNTQINQSKQTNSGMKSNWSVKLEMPPGKSIANQTSYAPGIKSTVVSAPAKATKNFFYDFPTQNRNTVSTVSLPADPLMTSTVSVGMKTNNSVKTEFPWIPSNPCIQNTHFTPSFDSMAMTTVVCDSLTSTSFSFSSAQTKTSSEATTVVDAGSKSGSNSRCNQMNLFLPYEETQYTPTFAHPTQSRPTTDNQSTWKPLDKLKDPSSADQTIFYDCEQSKPQQKSHVNWMTSPSTDFNTPTTPTTGLPLPAMDFGSQFTGNSTNFDLSFVGCRKDSYDDDNQFINWSPTKPLSGDFSTAYSFENFGSNEAPPNKTVKQIFSVSQLVDQTPSQDIASTMKKTMSKVPVEKSNVVPSSVGGKQTFSNIYSAESLIAKKDNNRFYHAPESATNIQADYHNSNSYFIGYSNAQNCSENDYLGAGASFSSSQQNKPINSGENVNPTFDPTPTPTTNNYNFPHAISSNNNDPYDPTYFPSSNYNQSWNHGTNNSTVGNKTGASLNIFNQGQFGTSSTTSLQETSSCQQNSNVSGNLTNFNLSSICPEIDAKKWIH